MPCAVAAATASRFSRSKSMHEVVSAEHGTYADRSWDSVIQVVPPMPPAPPTSAAHENRLFDVFLKKPLSVSGRFDPAGGTSGLVRSRKKPAGCGSGRPAAASLANFRSRKRTFVDPV